MDAILKFFFGQAIEEKRAYDKAIQVLDEAQRTRLQILIQEDHR